MRRRNRVALVIAAILATTALFAVAISSIAPLMHWLDRHPGAVTTLRLGPLLSLLFMAWVHHRRRSTPR